MTEQYETGQSALDGSPIEWDRATIRWAPEVSREASRLEVWTPLEGYAQLILRDELGPALDNISQVEGVLEVEIVAESGAGRIAITAERLTEMFDPGELRRCVQERVNAATFEGDRCAQQDEDRAREFLNALADE